MADIQTSTWSETASSNNAATPDGWPEGQTYASVNDCAREMMGALKREWNRSHATVTSGGTSTALTLTYTTAPAAYVQGLQFTFIVGTTCGANATLNVNSIGAKSIKKPDTSSGLASLLAADLRAGQIATVQYDSTADAFLLATPAPAVAVVPIGSLSPYAGYNPPTFWLFARGQAVSRSTYATLFSALTLTITATTTSGSANLTIVSTDLTGLGVEGAVVEGSGIPAGTTISSVGSSTTVTLSANATASASAVSIRILPHGRGDGSTTFNLPDLRGRVIAGRDNMGGTAANRITSGVSGITGASLGAAGGDQQMQQHTHGVTDPGHSHVMFDQSGSNGPNVSPRFVDVGIASNTQGSRSTDSATTGISIQNAGSGASQNVQPTVVLNWIIFAGA